jgi:hypothetical protein
MSDDGAGCCPAGFPGRQKRRKDVAMSSGHRSDSAALSRWIPPSLRRCYLSPVVGGAYQRSASETPAFLMPASNYCEVPVAAGRVTGDGPSSACRAEISHAARSRPRSGTDRCGRIHPFECSDAFLDNDGRGGRNEVTAEGRRDEDGMAACPGALEGIAAVGGSPGDE